MNNDTLAKPAGSGSICSDKVKIGIFLALICLAVYWPVKDFDFIDFDDPIFVSENVMVQKGFSAEGFRWAFTNYEGGYWHPLTWFSYMFISQFFGLDPGAQHVANLVFHIFNAVLLFFVLEKMTGAQLRSAFVAAFFALHPMHVESVAWISERKDVLSAFFGLLALGAYADYVKKAKDHRRSSRFHYGLALLFFAGSLMSKPMLVTLPFVLLLLDFWPFQRWANIQGERDDKILPARNILGSSSFPFTLSRWTALLFEKIPFFIMSVLVSLVTFKFQKDIGCMSSVEHVTLDTRLATALNAYGQYIVKFFYPHHMAVLYPYERVVVWGQILMIVVLLAVFFIIAWRVFRQRPFVMVGWLWFMGTLVPVIGIVQVGPQAFADRYTYFPYIGLFIAVGWWLHAVISRPAFIVVNLLLIAAWTGGAVRQLYYWQNTKTLFSHVIKVTSNNSLAYNNLGVALNKEGRLEEALEQFQTAWRINPKDALFRNNIGSTLRDLGRLDEAEQQYRLVLKNEPNNVMALNYLGVILMKQGRFEDAADYVQKTVQFKPKNAEARFHHGYLLSLQKRWNEAQAELREAIRLRPTYAEAYAQMGYVFSSVGDWDRAIACCREVIRLNPADLNAKGNLEKLLQNKKKESESRL